MDTPKLVQMIVIDMTPIGSLQVFALLTEREHFDRAPFDNKIYWHDHHTMKPQGPFQTVWLALENYKSVVLARFSTRGNTPMLPLPPPPKSPTLIDTSAIRVLSLDEFRNNRPKRDW